MDQPRKPISHKKKKNAKTSANVTQFDLTNTHHHKTSQANNLSVNLAKQKPLPATLKVQLAQLME